MNNSDQSAFNSALALAQSGYCDAAHSVFKSLVNIYPEDPNLLFWLVLTSNDKETAYSAIETLTKITPKNPALKALIIFHGLDNLREPEIGDKYIPKSESFEILGSSSKHS